MASIFDRIRRRMLRESEPLPAPAASEPDAETIEAALVEAEELAARTSELARDLHKILASGIAHRRATRTRSRILH